MFKRAFLAVVLISCNVASFAVYNLLFTALPPGYRALYGNTNITVNDSFPLTLAKSNYLYINTGNQASIYNIAYQKTPFGPTLVIQYGSAPNSSLGLTVPPPGQLMPKKSYCCPAARRAVLYVPLPPTSDDAPSNVVLSVNTGCPAA